MSDIIKTDLQKQYEAGAEAARALTGVVFSASLSGTVPGSTSQTSAVTADRQAYLEGKYEAKALLSLVGTKPIRN